MLTDKRYWNWNESMEFDSVDWTGCRIVDDRMAMTGDEEGVKTEVINLPYYCHFMTLMIMTDDDDWR